MAALESATNDEHTKAQSRLGLGVLYAAAVAGYPLIAAVPILLTLESRSISVPFRAVILALSIVVLLYSVHKRVLYTGALWVPLVVFWALYLSRMLSDTLFRPIPLSQPPTEYFLYGFGTCFLPMLALFTRASDATLRFALRLTTLVAGIAVITAMYLGIQSLLKGDFGSVMSSRFELWTLNPISLGHLGASLATLALFQLRSRADRTRGTWIFLVGAVAIGLTCTGVAASRGPIVALIVNCCFLLFLDWHEGHRLRVIVAALIIPLLAIQGARYLEELGFGVISRVQLAWEDPIRIDLLQGALAQFLAHPLMGSSLEERVSLTYPHNTFVESFMAVGLLGGLAYAAFHVMALQRAMRLLISRPAAGWLAILCVQYTISALFSGSVYASNTMWALLAAVVANEDRSRTAAGVSPVLDPV